MYCRYLEGSAFVVGRQRDANAVASRVPEAGRAVVDGGSGGDHVAELGLVGRGHDDHVGQACHVGDVERAAVRRPVRADQPGPVHGEPHRELLQVDVVHNLVVAALQERGVDGAEGLEALAGQAGGERHGVLLRDADVEAPAREAAEEVVEPRAAAHGRVDGHDLAVLLRLGDERLGEVVGVGQRLGRGLELLPGRRIKLGDTCTHRTHQSQNDQDHAQIDRYGTIC